MLGRVISFFFSEGGLGLAKPAVLRGLFWLSIQGHSWYCLGAIWCQGLNEAGHMQVKCLNLRAICILYNILDLCG